MDKKIVKKFNQHIQKISKAFFNVAFNFDPEDDSLNSLPNDCYYIIRADITGRSNQGQLIIGLPQKVAHGVTDKILSSLATSEIVLEELLESTLQEFLNTVTGQFIQEESFINDFGRFVYSPPASWIYNEDDKIGILKASNIVTKLTSEFGDIYSMISIRKIEQTVLQAELILKEKVTAVGEMAAGIAHEINNPLSAVLTYSNLISKDLEKNKEIVEKHFPKLMDQIAKIKEGTQRCASLAKNLLEFSHHKEHPFMPVNICSVLDNTLELIAANINKKSITVDITKPDTISNIMGDKIRLQQAFTNLILNATHVVADGGTILLSIKEEDGLIYILVNDNGPGIPKHLQKKVFTPFFTTKNEGVGTGMGLSITYSIIKDHDGDITFQSVKNKGTTFFIELPVAAE